MSAAHQLVLIVDHDEAILGALQFLLQLKGLTVRTHRDGSLLLADPSLASASCIILYDRLPRMDGFELLRRVAARKLTMPTILLTDHATPALRSRAAAAGVRLVLEKPLLNNALIDSVVTFLSGTA